MKKFMITIVLGTLSFGLQAANKSYVKNVMAPWSKEFSLIPIHLEMVKGLKDAAHSSSFNFGLFSNGKRL